jgi:hypothetical protein
MRREKHSTPDLLFARTTQARHFRFICRAPCGAAENRGQEFFIINGTIFVIVSKAIYP